MKICVYAICKNEQAFAERWMASMGEADAVYVLDTGSTDNTVAKLTALGAQVTVERIDQWRFDAARNRSLALVPEDADICVCTDLDEVFHSGWRALLEAAWQAGTTRAAYRYTWNFLPDGSEGHVFYADKIHAENVVTIGENELNSGVCQIKNMTDGTQKEIKIGEIPAYFGR